MLAAKGAYRFFTDADLPYDTRAMILAMAAFHEKDCDIVAGARDLAGSKVLSGLSMPRRLAGKVFSSAVQWMLDIDIRDTQCGFKGFTDRAAEQIFAHLKTRGYAFDVEILSRAKDRDMKICRIPVTLVKHGGSKIRLSRDPIMMLWELFRIARKASGHRVYETRNRKHGKR